MPVTLRQVLAADVSEILAQVNRTMPPMAPALWRAWQRDPENRFATAEEMGREIQAVHDELGPPDDLGEWVSALDLAHPVVLTRGEPTGPPEPQTLPTEAVEVLEVDEGEDGTSD